MPNAPIHPLAHIRQTRGWSQSDVAKIIAANADINMAAARQKIWRWEHGTAVPDRPSQIALAAALDIPFAQVLSCPWPDWLATEPLELDWSQQNVAVVLGQVVASAGMDRRNFMVLSGTGLATAALAAVSEPPIAAAVEGRKAGMDVVAVLSRRLEGLWYLDDMFGGGACLANAITDLGQARSVLAKASYNAATERALYQVTASIGRFAGWAAFDAGRHAAAQRLWHVALRIATAAGDRLQAAYILSNMAMQDIYVAQGRAAIDQLEAARAMVDPSARTVHAMLDCWQARAHGARGEGRAAVRLLNRGDDTWSNRAPGDDPDWIYWMPRPTATSEAGIAMLDAGEPAHAERILTEGMASSVTGARDRCLYLLRFAELYITVGQLDAAASSAAHAVDAAAQVDSHRINTRVDELVAMFPAGEPATSALRERWQARRPVAV